MIDPNDTKTVTETTTAGEVPVEKPEFNVSDWVKKFSLSEKIMKSEFLPQYNLARRRLQTRHNLRRLKSLNLTHEQVNMVYAIGTSYVNSVYFKSPNCNLKSREEVEHDKIENTEIKINDWLQDKKVAKTVKRILWDAYLGGSGWRYIDYVFEDQETGEPVIDEMGNPILGQDGMPQMQRLVLKNDIILKRIRPDMVRFPKGFDLDDYQDSSWIGFDVIMSREEIRAEDKWDPEGVEQIQFEKYSKLSNFGARYEAEEGETEYAKISYVFQRPATSDKPFKMVIFTKGVDKPLYELDYDKGVVGYPIKPIYHNPPDDDSSYPQGDPWIWESQLEAVDNWFKTYSTHVKRSFPHTIYDSTNVGKNELQRLKSSNDLEYVGIENKRGLPVTNLFYDRQKPPVSQDVTNFYTISRQLLGELAPKSGLNQGDQANKSGTATEAKIQSVGVQIDLEARIDDVKNFIIDIVLDVAGILTKSLVAPVTISKEVDTEMGKQTVFNDVNKDGFTDKINVDVEVESMQSQNKDVIRRQLIDSIGLLSKLEPMLNKVGKTINSEFWLEKLFDVMNVRNIEDGFIALPQTPPMGVPPGIPPGLPQGQGVPTMTPEANEMGQAQRA